MAPGRSHRTVAAVAAVVLLGWCCVGAAARERVPATIVTSLLQETAQKSMVDVTTYDTTKSPLAGDLYNITQLLIGPPGGRTGRARSAKSFIEGKMGWDFELRGRGSTGRRGYANVNPRHIHSGDVIGVLELGEADPLWMYATGSRLSKVAMALRYPNGTLYLVEAKKNLRTYVQSELNVKSPAIVKTEFNEWMKEIDHADLAGVVWLPISRDVREIWDNDKAVKHFETLEGLPFGYESMVFAWLDTLQSNYGPPLSAPVMTTGAQVMFEMYPEFAKDVFMQGFANRLGLKADVTFQGVQTAAAAKGYSLAQVATLPELDSYQYTTGLPPPDVADDSTNKADFKAAMQGDKPVLVRADYLHRSLTDSSLIIELYKKAGVFGPLADNIQASEFTIRDVYQLGVFQKNWHRPEGCLLDNFEYCQLGGKYALVLPGYNSVMPYSNMNFICPGVPPLYERPAGC